MENDNVRSQNTIEAGFHSAAELSTVKSVMDPPEIPSMRGAAVAGHANKTIITKIEEKQYIFFNYCHTLYSYSSHRPQSNLFPWKIVGYREQNIQIKPVLPTGSILLRPEL